MPLRPESLVPLEDDAAVSLICGVGQPGRICGQPAIGALAVHVHVGGLSGAAGSLAAAVVLLCVRHLAGFNEPAEAVFEPGSGPGIHPPADFPPGAGMKGA